MDQADSFAERRLRLWARNPRPPRLEGSIRTNWWQRLPRWEDAPGPPWEPPFSEQKEGRSIARTCKRTHKHTHPSRGVVSRLPFVFLPSRSRDPEVFFFFFKSSLSLSFPTPTPPHLSHGRDRIKTEKWRRSRCGEHVVSLLRH